jgi:ribonuclease HI
MKYYAVKSGRSTGIFETWEECKEQVDGFEGAEYKSFSNYLDATNYLFDKAIEKEKNITGPIAYVDGSYKEETDEYSFGVVLLIDGKEYWFKKSFPSDELSSMRNVAGEIKGAGFIILYCLNRGIKKLTIYHDYEGVSKWYQNEWKANLFGTKKYQEFANEVRNQIDVSFVKVKSHSNDYYNDLADKLAKEALGIN